MIPTDVHAVGEVGVVAVHTEPASREVVDEHDVKPLTCGGGACPEYVSVGVVRVEVEPAVKPPVLLERDVRLAPDPSARITHERCLPPFSLDHAAIDYARERVAGNRRVNSFVLVQRRECCT